MNEDIRGILQKAKQGDSDAFGLVYTEYYAPIYKYLYIRTKSKENAEDITQEVFLKAYGSIGSFEVTSTSPLAYFYTIARNALIDASRKKRVELVGDKDALDETEDDALTAEDAAILKEESAHLVECIEDLTDAEQECIALKFMSGLTNKEIAEVTGKNEAAVRQLQSRSLKKLSALFKKKYENATTRN